MPPIPGSSFLHPRSSKSRLDPDRSRDLITRIRALLVAGQEGREVAEWQDLCPLCPCFTKPETSSEVAKRRVLSVRATNNTPYPHTYTHVMIYKEQEKFS